MYSFVNREDDPHFSLSLSGILSVETTNKNTTTHYFIKLHDTVDQDRFEEEFIKLKIVKVTKEDIEKKINFIISNIL